MYETSSVVDKDAGLRLLPEYFHHAIASDAPAIRWGTGQTMSWAALGAAAYDLARRLCEDHGVSRGDRVAVCMLRDPSTLVVIYAVMLAGAVYFPVDPTTPAARLTAMMEVAECRVAFAQSAHAERIARTRTDLRVFDAAEIVLSQPHGGRGTHRLPTTAASIRGDDPAYLIFTSGSTGTPKGVLVNHAALANRLQWHQSHSRMRQDDVILQRTALTFDVSLWELFLPALSGGSLYLLRPGLEAFPRGIVHALAAGGVSIVHFVPSLLKPVLEELLQDPRGDAAAPRLRQVYVSGEALPASLVQRFGQVLGARASLCNLYGPTEAAIDVTYFDCDAPVEAAVPIGWPLPGCQLHIVHAQTRAPCADGEVGEISLGGICLAEGYLNRPELTSEVFVQHPQLGRIYLTGDLGWRSQEGLFFFDGRKDAQVKLRGLRVELGEIEHHLLQQPQVTAAAACVLVDADGEQWLVAAVAGVPIDFDARQVRERLAEHLPAYMLPARLMAFEQLPRSSSGKLDRRAIAAALEANLFSLPA
ncbi:MAG: amino acid adenylation domain-containing protein [Xanthomonas sp.]